MRATAEFHPREADQVVFHPARDMLGRAAHPDLAIDDPDRRSGGIAFAADAVHHPEHRHDRALGKRQNQGAHPPAQDIHDRIVARLGEGKARAGEQSGKIRAKALDRDPGRLTDRYWAKAAAGEDVVLQRHLIAPLAIEAVALGTEVDPHHAGIDLRQVAGVDVPGVQVEMSADSLARANVHSLFKAVV